MLCKKQGWKSFTKFTGRNLLFFNKNNFNQQLTTKKTDFVEQLQMAAIGNAIMLLEMQKPNLDPDKNLSGATTYTCVELFIQLRIFGTVVKTSGSF